MCLAQAPSAWLDPALGKLLLPSPAWEREPAKTAPACCRQGVCLWAGGRGEGPARHGTLSATCSHARIRPANREARTEPREGV